MNTRESIWNNRWYLYVPQNAKCCSICSFLFVLFFFSQERGSLHSKRSKTDVSLAVQCNQREVEHWQPDLPGVSGKLYISVKVSRQHCSWNQIETCNWNVIVHNNLILSLLLRVTKALPSDMACHVLTEMSPGGSLMTTTSETSMQRKCESFCQLWSYK